MQQSVQVDQCLFGIGDSLRKNVAISLYSLWKHKVITFSLNLLYFLTTLYWRIVFPFRCQAHLDVVKDTFSILDKIL